MNNNDEINEILRGEEPANINLDLLFLTLMKITKIDRSKVKGRVYYDLLINSQFEIPSSTTRWVDTLQVEQQRYFNSYMIHKATVNETKLLKFQYKIIHNIQGIFWGCAM